MSQLPAELTATPDHDVPAVVALGSNLGDSQQILHDAVTGFREHAHVTVTAVSPLAKTAPVGGPEQPDFLNQVLVLTTTLSPLELLEFAQQLEQAAARVRDIRWGPRTLDVDIICYADVTSQHPQLTLPHPRAQHRAFVLTPWAWADPDATLNGVRVAQLAAQADDAATVEQWDAADREEHS